MIIRCFKGNFNLKEAFEKVKESCSHKAYHKSLNIINDIRFIELDMDYESVLEFIKAFKSNVAIYGEKRKSVLLTNTPNQAAFSTLLNLKKDDDTIDLKVTSTIEAAIAHIKISEKNKKHISNLIENMAKST